MILFNAAVKLLLLLIEYLVKATPLLSTWNRPFKEQIHDSLRLKITHFLKRDTMRMTGGKMIMLDMMPTLISCKKYLHPEPVSEEKFSPARRN